MATEDSVPHYLPSITHSSSDPVVFLYSAQEPRDDGVFYVRVWRRGDDHPVETSYTSRRLAESAMDAVCKEGNITRAELLEAREWQTRSSNSAI